MKFEEKITQEFLLQCNIMTTEEFVAKHPLIQEKAIKTVNFMTDQLVQGTWRGLSLDYVDFCFMHKQRVKDAINKVMAKRRPEGQFVDGYIFQKELRKELGFE